MGKITPLVEADVPDALRLSTQAGWNQIEADWLRLIQLWPNFCLALREGPALVATATLAVIGEGIGWVGMILVDEASRGKGYGKRMLKEILRVGEEGSITTFGLDATEMGRPLYLKEGFVDGGTIERWSGPVGSFSPDERCTLATNDDVSAFCDFDRMVTGLSRSELLKQLAIEKGGSVRVVLKQGVLAGYGMSRRGRTAGYIGPVVALEESVGEALMASLVSDLGRSGETRVIVDVESDLQREAMLTPWLREHGFERRRTLVRMWRSAEVTPCSAGSSVPATAGLELG